MVESVKSSRWTIAVAGTLLQLCLGTVYAWSYFQNPICTEFGWSNTQVAWIFSLAIFSLGLAAAWGGINLPRHGPRRLAVAGAALFAAGYLVGALALQVRSLPLLYVGYGVIGGTGLGLAYVTPVATVANWFPDRKGLATGLVIMGFGFGALLMSKLLAPLLVGLAGGNLVCTFAVLGLIFLLLGVPVAAMMRNPPADYAPGRLAPATVASAGQHGAAAQPTGEGRGWLGSRQFILMWIIFFCNITAGIAIISFQSPIFQEIWRKSDPGIDQSGLAALGATLIAVSSIFNGLGRFLWGGLSDRIGRSRAFSLMLATQAIAFALLIVTTNPWLCAALICYVLLCYGGGFGTMPSFVLDIFGPRHMPIIYGTILTAWSCGGIVGPQLMALIKDHFGDQAILYSCLVAIGLLATGLLLSLFMRVRPAASAAAPMPVAAAAPPAPDLEITRVR